MDELGRTTRYLFILALVLVLVAYNVGAGNLGRIFFAGLNQTGNTFTGRNQQGQFAAYPAGG